MTCRANTHLRPEDGCIGLHGLLQLAADLRHTQAALGVAQLVQALYRVGARICRQIRLGSSWLASSAAAHTTMSVTIRRGYDMKGLLPT